MPSLAFSQARRALSLAEKGKVEDAFELLHKSIQKDSLAPAEHYVIASFFIDEKKPFYDIDSAYTHVNLALVQFPLLDEKHQQKLVGDGFDTLTYLHLKRIIERAGFERAKIMGRESDYILYLQDFPGSYQTDSAIFLRNQQAFVMAAKENTYAAYEKFFQTYPKANDSHEAHKRYENLLYHEKTKTGKLKAYQQFLTSYPDTWHRKDAEKAIFKILTGKNSIEAYQDFIDQYPESYLAKKAKLYLYAKLSTTDKEAFLGSMSFNKATTDSLNEVHRLNQKNLLLTIEDDQPALLDTKGQILRRFKGEFDSLTRCRDNPKLLATINQNEKSLLNRTGRIIYTGDFEKYSANEDLIRIKENDGSFFIHLNGDRINSKPFREAFQCGPFLAYKQNTQWGLMSITGILMLPEEYDSIAPLETYILLGKEGKWGLVKTSNLYQLLDGEPVDLLFPYDEIEVLSNHYFLVSKGEEFGVIDDQNNLVIPPAKQSIEWLEDGYFLETNDSILDSRLANVWYRDIISNKYWTIGVRAATYDIYYDGIKQFEANDARLVGTTAILVSQGENEYCYFNKSTKIPFKEGDRIKPVRKMGEQSTIRHYIFTDSKKGQMVIDQHGKRVKIPRFDRLIDLGENYMIFSVKGFIYNVLDNSGKVLLKNVDAATSLNDGYISFLRNGKFGLFNVLNDTYIEPKYDRPIKGYANEMFVVEENGRKGIINRHDSVILSPNFDDIIYHTDSSAIIKSDFRYAFWNFRKGGPRLDNVSNYWEFENAGNIYYKIFKGIGYGIWNPTDGIILNPTFNEIEIKSFGDEMIFIGEKWVDEAGIVVLLYYDNSGKLLYKTILNTDQYEALSCPGRE